MSDLSPHDALAAPPEVEPVGVDRAKYAVSSQLEVTQILRGLMRDAAMLTAYFDGGSDFFLTSIVEIDDTQGCLWLEPARDAQQNQRVLARQRVLCVGNLDRVQIQFACQAIEAATVDGRPALASALPVDLLRLQRREHFRIQTPLVNGLKCTVTDVRSEKPVAVELTVLDISCGGLGAATPAGRFNPETGVHYPCSFALPGAGTLNGTIEAHHSYVVKGANGTQSRRTGFSFVNAPGPMLSAIQRYIMKLERERKARS